MPEKTKPKLLAWMDLETTGLEPDKDFILEVAVILTDLNLNIEARPWSTVVQPGVAGWLDKIKSNPIVNDMHQKSGLYRDLVTGLGMDAANVERRIMLMLSNHCSPGEVMMAGTGVQSFDLAFVKHHWPVLAEWFDYRTVDLGGTRRFLKYIVDREDLMPPEDDASVHRAMADVDASLRQAKRLKTLLKDLLSPRVGSHEEETE